MYIQNLSVEAGRPAISSRIAFGVIFIKEFCHITDDDTVQQLQENSYMQYFVGLHEFHAEPLFDPSMTVHFRKRFPVEEVAKINEYVCTGKWSEEQRNVDRNNDEDDGDEPPVPPSGEEESGAKVSRQKGKENPNTSKKERRKKNRGKLLLDATVAPADIRYPTDIDLLNKSREHLETAVNILWQHNEGCDLQAAVEDYKRKFGCYPSAVLADRIYQTRSNKLFVPNMISACPVRLWAAEKPR